MWKKISTRKLFEHPRLTVLEDDVLLPNGISTQYLYFEPKSDAVMVICHKDNQILVQQEYSYPPNEVMYQFPGGAVEENETELQAAQRELQEESGQAAGKYSALGWFYKDNRRSSARMHVFLAEDVSSVVKAGGDQEEDISSEWLTIEDINLKIHHKEVVNYSMLAAWALFLAHQN